MTQAILAWLLSTRNGPPESLHRFSRPTRASTSKKTRTAPSTVSPELCEEYPWLSAAVGAQGRRGSGSASKANDASAPSATDVLPEEVIDAAWDELLAKRREHEAVNDCLGASFTTKVLGGRWTRANKKKAFDAVIGMAVGASAKAWCRQYGLNIEASYAFNKYGNDAATQMAVEWCRRMSHFHDIYLASGDKMYIYSKDDLGSYEEDSEWLDFLAAQDADSAMWTRAEGLRCLFPEPKPRPAASASSSKARKTPRM